MECDDHQNAPELALALARCVLVEIGETRELHGMHIHRVILSAPTRLRRELAPEDDWTNDGVPGLLVQAFAAADRVVMNAPADAALPQVDWATDPRRPELVPLPVRNAVRDAMSGWGPYTVTEISELFVGHGFRPSSSYVPSEAQRASEVESFQDAIDWTDGEEVGRYFGVVEEVLDANDNDDYRARQGRPC